LSEAIFSRDLRVLIGSRKIASEKLLQKNCFSASPSSTKRVDEGDAEASNSGAILRAD
jgi:hypothetical protein